MAEDVISAEMTFAEEALITGSDVTSYRSVNPADYDDAVARLPDNPWLNPAARMDAIAAGGRGGGEMNREMLEQLLRDGGGGEINREMLEQLLREEGAGGDPGNLDLNANPLLLLLQTLLPWNRI
jgi:hypothetical protein